MIKAANLEGNLWGECELVSLKETPSGVHKHRVCDAVNEVLDTLVDIIWLFSPLYGLVEHNTEGLQQQNDTYTMLLVTMAYIYVYLL